MYCRDMQFISFTGFVSNSSFQIILNHTGKIIHQHSVCKPVQESINCTSVATSIADTLVLCERSLTIIEMRHKDLLIHLGGGHSHDLKLAVRMHMLLLR